MIGAAGELLDRTRQVRGVAVVWRRRLVCACIWLLAFPAAVNAQTAMQQLTGTWLLEPASFDVFVDQGVALPSVPVLSIGADGSFELFRLAAYCMPWDESGRLIPLEEPVRLLDACAKWWREGRAEGFRHSHVFLSAAGRLELRADHIFFHVTKQGVAADYVRQGFELAKREGRSLPGGYPAETFYTTYFVGDGRTMLFSVDADQLSLSIEKTAMAFLYRKYAPQSMDTAVALTELLGLASGSYFRCILRHTDALQRGEKSKVAGLERLIEIAHEYLPLSARRQRANALEAVGDDAQSAHERRAAKPAKLEKLTLELMDHPVTRAASENRLGVLLGCPQKDR